MYRAVIADDHAIVREGIALIVDESDDFTVVAQAQDGNQLLESLHKIPCDIVLCDIVMPGLNGFKILQKVKSANMEIKVVFITMHQDRNLMSEAVELGVDGYVLKNDNSETILAVLRQVMEGHRSFSFRVQTMLAYQHLANQSPKRVLTKREFEVFQLVVNAHNKKEVSHKLNIDVATVELHKKNIKNKLHAKNLADLLNIAQKYDII